MRVRRWRWAAMTAMLIVGTVVWRAAKSDEESRSYSGELVLLDDIVPARAGIARPPGTPIVDGFVVAEGSYLLGTAMPSLYSTMHDGDPIEDDGYQAWLLITEPIGDVVDRYRAQAVAAGYEMSPVECTEEEGVVGCVTACVVQCDFGGETGYEHGRTFGIGGKQGVAGPDQPPVSYASIYLREIGDPPYPGDGSDQPPPEPPPSNRGAVPVEWPPLPDVGERIHSFNEFEVVPGTVLLVHGINATSHSGETTAIFEVVDDVDAVIDRFTSQMQYPPDDPTRETMKRGGHRIDTVYWTDGQAQTLEFHDPPDGPTILVLTSYVAD